MVRGRSSSGGRGRGRVSLRVGSLVSPAQSTGALSPSPVPLVPVDEPVLAIRARRGRGRGRGGGRRGVGRPPKRVAADWKEQLADSTGPEDADLGAVPLPSVSTATPPPQQQQLSQSTNVGSGVGAGAVSPASPVVVVELPPRRMITRSLLNGTSPAIEEYVAAAAAAARQANPSPEGTASVDRERAEVDAAKGGRGRGRGRGTARGGRGGSSVAAAAAVAGGRATSSAARRGRGGSVGGGSAATKAEETSVLPSSPTVIIGGVLRCVCNAFLVSSQETLLECARCHNWCHPACVGVDHAELRHFQKARNYTCPYCVAAAENGSSASAASHTLTAATAASGNGESVGVDYALDGSPFLSNSGSDFGSPTWPTGRDYASGQNGGVWASPMVASAGSAEQLLTASRRPPVPRQVPLRLREIPDRLPNSTQLVEQLLYLIDALRRIAKDEKGYVVIDLPAAQLSAVENEQCLECCAAAVQDATFSESYPVYCLKEVRNKLHPYVQGTVLRALPHVPLSANPRRGKVCSMVLSNGMDGYGTLKPTITQLKSAIGRGIVPPEAVTPFMSQCVAITDVSEFIHITISATHSSQQRRGLAKLLMAMDLLKWALRGRTKAFLNMAIEKRLVDNGSRVEYASSPASKHLYERFGFLDVFPRFDPLSGKERWTAREADMGRVMANLNFVPHAVRIAESFLAQYEDGDRSRNGGSGTDERKRSRSPTSTTAGKGKDDGAAMRAGSARRKLSLSSKH